MAWNPPVEVPFNHPLLRTSVLLRLGRQEAADLACLVDALSADGAGRARPKIDRLGLIAQDLRQCHTVLEVFDDKSAPDGEFFDHLRAVRNYVGHAVQDFAALGRDPLLAIDPRNPLHAVAEPRMRVRTHGALGRLGSRVVEAFEEGEERPRLMQDAFRASALGAICDLDLVVGQLRRSKAGGPKGRLQAAWASTLARQVEILTAALPADEDSTQDSTEEWPIPGRGKEADA